MGRKAGQTHMQELKEQQLKEFNSRGGKKNKILQWKDLPPQVKMKIDKKTKKA
jgi:hypothetical protein